MRTMVLTKERLLVILLSVFALHTGKTDATTCATLPIKKPLIATHVGSEKGFGVGAVLRFNCEKGDRTKPFYALVGYVKIECQKDGKWSSKIPKCVASACPVVGPSVPNAQLLKPIIPRRTNNFGNTISYKCNLGFIFSSGKSFTCQKNGYWEGNVTCVDVVCPRPFIYNGNVTYRALGYGSQANYSCDTGYVITDQPIRICNRKGQWSGNIPRCLRQCPKLSFPSNGYIQPIQKFCAVGCTVRFKCHLRYQMRGPDTRTCQSDGRWSGYQPKCVINTCGSPGPFTNGKIMSSMADYTIGTVVSFSCYSGFKLIGDTNTRTCRADGHWTGIENPRCIVIFCEEPGVIPFGTHDKMQGNGHYHYGDSVTYSCNSQYYLWGNATLTCRATSAATSYWSELVPTCLTLSGFDEECVRHKGKFKVIRRHPYCLFPDTKTTPLSGKSKSDRELDTLTIVTASAGSTLGALVILLSVMVFVRRFHRNRRFRNHSIRSRFYSDDDHVTLIATYRGDVHFTLPSYDEAMSQVQRDPPPFESVVQTNGTGTTNNNSGVLAITDGSLSNPQGGANRDNSSAHAQNENTADEQINIVSNPMNVDSSGGTSLLSQATNQGGIPNESQENEMNSFLSELSLVASDAPSSLEGLNLSGSEDEQSVNESQPLISTNTLPSAAARNL